MTNRIAEDRLASLCVFLICRIRSVRVVPFAVAISCNASQNAFSRLTLVALPDIRTVLLSLAGSLGRTDMAHR
jgi:hypothetical protein